MKFSFIELVLFKNSVKVVTLKKKGNKHNPVRHTYTQTSTTDYDDCLTIFEKFCVLFVLNQAHRNYDRPSQHEEHTEVKQGDSSIQTFVSISITARTANTHLLAIWTLEIYHLQPISLYFLIK